MDWKLDVPLHVLFFLCFRSYEIKDALHDLVPTASNDEIDSALSNACGNMLMRQQNSY